MMDTWKKEKKKKKGKKSAREHIKMTGEDDDANNNSNDNTDKEEEFKRRLCSYLTTKLQDMHHHSLLPSPAPRHNKKRIERWGYPISYAKINIQNLKRIVHDQTSMILKITLKRKERKRKRQWYCTTIIESAEE